MRRVLVVSFYYPPWNWSAALRSAKMLHHLPDLGWSATVVHADLEPWGSPDPFLGMYYNRHQRIAVRLSGPGRYVARSQKGFLAVPLRRLRSLIGRSARSLAFPDLYAGWARSVERVVSAQRLYAGVDVVLATGGPFSVFLAGAAIAERHN